MLAPTRELAQQIAAVLEEAGARAGLRALCAYGGVPKPPQAAALRRGVDVLVATPGRLEDLMQDGVCRRVHLGATPPRGRAQLRRCNLLKFSLYAGTCWQQGHFLHERAG